MSDFDGADFYTAFRDAEIYDHTDWHQCLIDFIDGAIEGPPEEYGGEPITIYAAKRLTIDDKWFFWASERAATDVEECFSEEYGPIDDPPDIDTEAIRKVFEAVLRGMIKNGDVWRCEIVAEKTFTLEEIWELGE